MTFHSQLNIIRIILGIIFLQILSGTSDSNNNKMEADSTDPLFSNLISIEKKSMSICQSILESMAEEPAIYDIETLITLYDINKQSTLLMNQLVTQALGNIGDQKVVPILMDIAQNNDLPVSIRSSSVEILSKKQAPELVDLLVEMLGDPKSRDKVNEFALNVMGNLSEERMIMALLETYQLARNKYYSLLNTIMNSMDNYEDPKIKSVYKEIAGTKELPNNIRLKAFKGLIHFPIDSETADEVIELLNDPANYVYYQEIITMLIDYGIYDNYKAKLRMAAFNAMKKDSAPFGMTNE